mgnify:CR=1 FL=1
MSQQETEQWLIDISERVGNISQCGHNYTSGLAKFIHLSGKRLGALTVSELLSLEHSYREQFNHEGG